MLRRLHGSARELLEGGAENEVREAVTRARALARDRDVIAASRAEVRGPVRLRGERAEVRVHLGVREFRWLAEYVLRDPLEALWQGYWLRMWAMSYSS